MNFEYPSLLILLLPLSFLWWLHMRRGRSTVEKRRFPWFLLSIAFSIVALANPYWSTVPAKRLVKGVDLILVVDVSQSMFSRTGGGGTRRIDQARNFLRTLLPSFAGTQTSVLYFAGDAQIGSPFTTDLQAIYLFLDSVTPAMSAKPGTLTESLESLLDQLAEKRRKGGARLGRKPLALLFSDGEFFDGVNRLNRWFSKHEDFRVFSFLCGKGRSPVPKYDLSGAYPGAYSQVQPQNLQSLAATSGGAFFDLSRATAHSIAKEVSKGVEDFIAEGDVIPDYRPLPFLLLSLLCLMVYQFFPAFLSLLPQRVTAIAAIFLLLFVSLSMMKPERRAELFLEARKDVKEGRHKDALEKLRRLQKDRSSEEIEIAIGNLYFRQRKFDEAISFYRQALQYNSASQIARWNWEVALKRKSQPNQPPPGKEESPQQQPPPPPQELPDQTRALLKYFDQLEKEQIQQNHRENAKTTEFAW